MKNLTSESISSPLPPREKEGLKVRSEAFFDASASVLGNPNQPGYSPSLGLTLLQSFVQSLSTFRERMVAMSEAADGLVRSMEELADSATAVNGLTPETTRTVDAFLDSTRVYGNVSQVWALSLERDVEVPLTEHLRSMEHSIQLELETKSRRIDDLMVQLDNEEKNAHRESKKRHRDFEVLKESIQKRMNIVDEINQLKKDLQYITYITTRQNINQFTTKIGNAVALHDDAMERLQKGVLSVHELDLEQPIDHGLVTPRDSSDEPKAKLSAFLSEALEKL